MAKRKAPKGPKTLFDKVKEVDEYFVQEVYTLSDDQLRQKLSDISIQTSYEESNRDKDDDLKQKQEVAKEAGKKYSEPINALKLKRKMVFQILSERGKAP